MDFESPDVAKEFPGLYMGDLEVGVKSDGGDYEEDQDKSKKKKDKKKDKEKGYAALAGESSHDEDEGSKSPGKTKKIMAFKLSSKKKNKEKEREAKPLEPQAHSSSIIRTGSMREKRPFDRERKPMSEKELRKSAEKEIKSAKGHSILSGSISISSTSQRLSLPTSASTKITHPAPERTYSLTKNLTLNAFLNAPAPLLKKKKEKEIVAAADPKGSTKKDKRSKEEVKKVKEKEHSSKEPMSLVRLKLKRGSKNSLEDSQSGNSPVAPSHQFSETPDAIAKDIRKYEGLLEQCHAQIKSSKKVSKKSEEQLWELQRTLTQLKRKLRSVNALSSASSANIVLSSSSSEKPTIKDLEKLTSAIIVKPNSASITVPLVAVASTSASIPIPKSDQVGALGMDNSLSPQALDNSTTDLLQQSGLDIPKEATATSVVRLGLSSSAPLVDCVKQLSANLDTSLDSKEPSQSETSENQTEEIANNELKKSPGGTSLETIQVYVQVHNNEVDPRSILLTPEDIFEKEIEHFDPKTGLEPVRNCPSPIIMEESTIEVPITSELTPENSSEEYDSEDNGSDMGSDDGEYVEIRKVEMELKPLIYQSEETIEGDIVPAFAVDELDEGEDDFDPFAVPLFHTDEFIGHENAALITFNQKLQDEIVKEEDGVSALIKEYKYLTNAGYKNSTLEDLENLDDDELAELWYSRKVENEALHDKVNDLRMQVVAGILEEFQLETRLRYLQEKQCQPL